jgi:hypothetical protein
VRQQQLQVRLRSIQVDGPQSHLQVGLDQL